MPLCACLCSSRIVWCSDRYAAPHIVAHISCATAGVRLLLALPTPQQWLLRTPRTFKTYVHSKQESLLKHIIRSPIHDPLRQATLNFNSSLPATPLLRRVGRPRTLWADAIYSRIWKREYNTNNLYKFKDNHEANIKRVADAAISRAI